MNITWDQVTANRAHYDTQQGWQIPRACVLTGVTNTGADFLTKTVNDAIAAELLPALNSAHPNIANAYCYGYEPEGLSQNTVRVIVLYRQWAVGSDIGGAQESNVPVLRFSASLGQVETNKDRHGASVKVTYTSGDSTNEQGVIGHKLVPEFEIQITRMEIGSPATRIRPYMESVSQTGFFAAPADPEGVWKFMGCVAESRDFGLTYQVTYTFAYRQDGWKEEKTYIDPETGRPPPDVSDANGIVKIDHYEPMNYNALMGVVLPEEE